MKLQKFKITTFLLMIVILLLPLFKTSAQDNPTQSYAKSNTYVKITWDTTDFSATPYSRTNNVLRSGIITNQSSSIDMEVLFARDTYGNGRDSNTYIRIPPGKTYTFTTRRKKVFRRMLSGTAGDSAKSQVILGEVKLSYNSTEDNNSEYTFASGVENDSGSAASVFNRARDWIDRAAEYRSKFSNLKNDKNKIT